MNYEDMSDEEAYKSIKRPSTGLAAKYAKKQLNEENILAKLLVEQAKKYNDPLLVLPTEEAPPVAPTLLESKFSTKKLTLAEAKAQATPVAEKQPTKKIEEDDSVTKEYYTLSLHEAVDLLSEAALEENWKDNIDSLSPGKQDTIKKLLALADSIRNNKPVTEIVVASKAITTPLFEQEQLKTFTVKEAMHFVHSFQEEQKVKFQESKAVLIEHWSDAIAEMLIENKKHIVATVNGKIQRVE